MRKGGMWRRILDGDDVLLRCFYYSPLPSPRDGVTISLPLSCRCLYVCSSYGIGETSGLQ